MSEEIIDSIATVGISTAPTKAKFQCKFIRETDVKKFQDWLENGNVKYINKHNIYDVKLETHIEYYSNTPKAYIGIYTWYEYFPDIEEEVPDPKILAAQVEAKNTEIAKLKILAKNLLTKIDDLENPVAEITPANIPYTPLSDVVVSEVDEEDYSASRKRVGGVLNEPREIDLKS